jgi:Ulp1 family protease
VPTQDNSCDCGVFVLKYGELMLGPVLDTLPYWTEADLEPRQVRSFFPSFE